MGGVIVIRMSYVALQRVFYILSLRNDSNSRIVVSSFADAAAFAPLEPVYGIQGVTYWRSIALSTRRFLLRQNVRNTRLRFPAFVAKYAR